MTGAIAAERLLTVPFAFMIVIRPSSSPCTTVRAGSVWANEGTGIATASNTAEGRMRRIGNTPDRPRGNTPPGAGASTLVACKHFAALQYCVFCYRR